MLLVFQSKFSYIFKFCISIKFSLALRIYAKRYKTLKRFYNNKYKKLGRRCFNRHFRHLLRVYFFD